MYPQTILEKQGYFRDCIPGHSSLGVFIESRFRKVVVLQSLYPQTFHTWSIHRNPFQKSSVTSQPVSIDLPDLQFSQKPILEKQGYFRACIHRPSRLGVFIETHFRKVGVLQSLHSQAFQTWSFLRNPSQNSSATSEPVSIDLPDLEFSQKPILEKQCYFRACLHRPPRLGVFTEAWSLSKIRTCTPKLSKLGIFLETCSFSPNFKAVLH